MDSLPYRRILLRPAALLPIAIFLTAIGGCQTELMPTPTIYRSAAFCEQTFSRVPEEFQSNREDILFVTDRKPIAAKGGRLEYGYERSHSLAYGSCVVEIGKAIAWETLVKNSGPGKRSVPLPLSLVRITEQNRFPETPLPVTVKDGKVVIDPYQQHIEDEIAAQFQQEIRRRLEKTAVPEAYVFLHGNFASFEDGLFMIAGLWHFLGRQGVPIAYSWPAGSPGGMLRQYTYDTTSGAFTVFHLKQFLRWLAACPEVKKIHIVSHSQGTNIICNAVRELLIEARAAGIDPLTRYKIGNLILAAPDIDYEVALQRIAAEQFYEAVDQLTLYVSRHDKMLGAADWLFRKERLGQIQISNIPESLQQRGARIHRTQIIDADVKTAQDGHYYFYTSPAVSSDLILLLRGYPEPGQPDGRPLLPVAPNYWKITDTYGMPGASNGTIRP